MESWKIGKLGMRHKNFFHFSILPCLTGNAGIFPKLEMKFYSLFINVSLFLLSSTQLIRYLYLWCMSWFNKYYFILVVGLALTPGDGFAQENMKQLENQRIQLEKSIEYTEVLLEDTRKDKFVSLHELALLNDQIENRQKLIDIFTEESRAREDSIFSLLIKMDELALDVEALKKEYARMIYHAYLNNNAYQRMFYVLASNDFNQAFQRANYFKVYASKRKNQVELIKDAENKYLSKIEDLELNIENTENLLTKLEDEKNLLKKEKQRKDITLHELGKQENDLLSKQESRRKKAEQLKLQIENIIVENMDTHVVSSSTEHDAIILNTPENEILNTNFNLNRGHLPWPLEKGVVSSCFGEHAHPDLQGIMVRNNGINIMTHQGSKARAIFNGEVTRVMAMPNFNNVVIIRHGNFLTVYTNLDEVFVEPGKSVKTKEEIGRVFTNQEQYKTELHFEIWEGKTLLDPEMWLASDKPTGSLN
jgi:septal ring factor EnvC (AmiA/AmiB activator)